MVVGGVRSRSGDHWWQGGMLSARRSRADRHGRRSMVGQSPQLRMCRSTISRHFAAASRAPPVLRSSRRRGLPPRRASGGDDDALGVFGDGLGVHARPLQLALEGSMREDSLSRLAPDRCSRPSSSGACRSRCRDVGPSHPQDAPIRTDPARCSLHADDRLDRPWSRSCKLSGTRRHVSVVGHPLRRHPHYNRSASAEMGVIFAAPSSHRSQCGCAGARRRTHQMNHHRDASL